MAIKVDWNAVPESTSYAPIPEGTYKAKIVNVTGTKKDGTAFLNKAGEQMWSVRFEIIEGNYAERLIFDSFNVENPLKMQKAKALYTVVFGSKLPSKLDESDLIDEEVMIDVTIKDGRNEIPFGGYHAA